MYARVIGLLDFFISIVAISLRTMLSDIRRGLRCGLLGKHWEEKFQKRIAICQTSGVHVQDGTQTITDCCNLIQ